MYLALSKSEDSKCQKSSVRTNDEKNRITAVFFRAQACTSVMGSMRFVRACFAQSLGIVIAWRGIRDRPGLVDAAGVLGMGNTRGRDTMTVVIVALAAEVVSAGSVVTGGLAGVIASQSLAMAIAGSVARMVRACTTATNAMTTTVSTAVAATATAVTTTAFFCSGSADDRKFSGEKWSYRQHQGAGHDSNETLVFYKHDCFRKGWVSHGIGLPRRHTVQVWRRAESMLLTLGNQSNLRLIKRTIEHFINKSGCQRH